MIRHNQFGLAYVYVFASMLKAHSDDGQCGNVRGSSLSETAIVIIKLSVPLVPMVNGVSSLREGITWAMKKPGVAGVYKADGTYCLGRPVFKHSGC